MTWCGVPIAGVRVLGLCGAARHGKDQLARLLCELVPGAERFALSDGIAAFARAHGWMTKRDPRTLQEVGWELRQARPGAWLEVLYGAIDDRRPPLAIVTGIRFADEAALVRQMGGQLLRVVRLEADGRPFVDQDRDPAHPVERQIATLSVDAEIVARSGDLEALRAAAQRFAA